MTGSQFKGNNEPKSQVSLFGELNPPKIIAMSVIILFTISFSIITIYLSLPKSDYDKNIDSATIAAKKYTPNAQVSDLKISNGFAIAMVKDPGADSQAAAGNETIFRVNSDGSMSQIADGSSFNPIDLLGYGMRLSTQASLRGSDIEKERQNLFDACGYYSYSPDTPGYLGFKSSFNPGNWQIDSAMFDDIYQTLTDKITSINSNVEMGEKIVCVNAARDGSNAQTDNNTSISTFTLKLQFISWSGELTEHIFTFSTGPNYYRSYTLDEKDLP